MYRCGYEIALHLHPQWYNARFERGNGARLHGINLCTLPQPRIAEIVDRSVNHLPLYGRPSKSSALYRSGPAIGCFQPTRNAAWNCPEGACGSTFGIKGGLQRNHHLDYRPSQGKMVTTGRSARNVNERTPWGSGWNSPSIRMVPPWKMVTSKRMGMGNALGGSRPVSTRK